MKNHDKEKMAIPIHQLYFPDYNMFKKIVPVNFESFIEEDLALHGNLKEFKLTRDCLKGS